MTGPGGLARRLGYRGLALTMFGAMFAVIGVGVLGNPVRDAQLLHTLLPIWVRVGLWTVAGLSGVVTAWRARWQPLGFAALTIPPAERALSFTWAMISEPSIARLTGAAVYVLLSATIVLFSAWPEPTLPRETDHAT